MLILRLRNRLVSLAVRILLASRSLPKNLAVPLLIYGLIAEGRTMLSRRRMDSLFFHSSDPQLPAGAFVKCGVARGGSLALMSLVSGGKRQVWGFDSFEGMPKLTEEDKNEGKEWVGYQCSGPDGLKEAQRTFRRFSVGGNWVKLVQGWFEGTLPKYVADIGPIAVLRLDNDWYKSTLFCLETLYASVSKNGFVIIDDYHTFVGCRDAVDQFRAKRGITSPMITTEPNSEAYWRKID